MSADCPTCAEDAAKFAAKLLRTPGVAKPQTIRDRREVCKGCPHLDPHHMDLPSWANFSKCRLCDCNVAQKTKAQAAQCPDTPPRWEAETV